MRDDEATAFLLAGLLVGPPGGGSRGVSAGGNSAGAAAAPLSGPGPQCDRSNRRLLGAAQPGAPAGYRRGRAGPFGPLLAGGRVSLLVGFASAALGGVLGVPLGLLAGYKGGKWEYWIMRACDTFQSFPSILLVLAMVTLLGPSVWNIILVIAAWAGPRWPGWCTAAPYRPRKPSMWRPPGPGGHRSGDSVPHHSPQRGGPGVGLPAPEGGPAILSESSLSFLGVGLRTPQASWGNLTQSAMELVTLTTRPWAWLPPGLCIVATGLARSWWGRGCGRPSTPQPMRKPIAFWAQKV